MELQKAKQLVEIGQENGLKCSLRENYSGRYMFGKITAGVVTESIPDLVALAVDNDIEIVDYSRDNMGKDFIIY